jgi:hypothetical protein
LRTVVLIVAVLVSIIAVEARATITTGSPIHTNVHVTRSGSGFALTSVTCPDAYVVSMEAITDPAGHRILDARAIILTPVQFGGPPTVLRDAWAFRMNTAGIRFEVSGRPGRVRSIPWTRGHADRRQLHFQTSIASN